MSHQDGVIFQFLIKSNCKVSIWGQCLIKKGLPFSVQIETDFETYLKFLKVIHVDNWGPRHHQEGIICQVVYDVLRK